MTFTAPTKASKYGGPGTHPHHVRLLFAADDQLETQRVAI